MSGRRSSGHSGGVSENRRGQSEVVGVVLILGIVSLGIASVVLYGDAAVADLQSQSELEGIEQAMTVFDSRAALVALGETDVQSVSMGQTSEGGYSVRPTAGTITITHISYTDTASSPDLDPDLSASPDPDPFPIDDGPDDDDEELYSGTLGSVVYERDGTEIAYQGGGVWKKVRDGDARMISPPELYYQGSTLTLPIIQTQGSGGGGGATSATIRSATASTAVFPDASATYPNTDPYQNSITNGEIVITVQSEYAGGWEEYFEERTSSGAVTRSGDTVQVKITSLSAQGPFPMPPDESFLSVSGFEDDHPTFTDSPYTPALDPFEITLRPDDSDSANFANLQWSLYVKQGNQEFEIHLRRRSGKDCSNPPVVSATVYYTNDYGNTYQGWYDDDAFVGECGDYNGDGNDEIRLVANLAGDNAMEYGSLTSSKLGDEVSTSGASLTNSATFDQHSGDATADGTPRTYAPGETETMDRLMDHYFTLLGPTFTLVVDDKNSDTVSEDASYGNIQYPTTADSITFLHVTENEIEVEFE